MFNKKSFIVLILTLFIMGISVGFVFASDNSDLNDTLTVNDESSQDKLQSAGFDDGEAQDTDEIVDLNEMKDFADKSLPANDIKELREAKNSNINLVKKYTYYTTNGYKLVKIKSNTYKTVYVTKSGLKNLKQYGSTENVYKKIPKSLFYMSYDKKLSKTISKNEWKVKNVKKVKKTYKWKDYKYMQKKVGSKKVWVTKKIKTYESWVDSNGYLYKSKSWNPYQKYGYNIKYIKSEWKYYSDGDICWGYYRVKVNKPIYKDYSEPVYHKHKITLYKVKLKQIKYKKVKVPDKLTVFTRVNKQPGVFHDYYYKGDHMTDSLYWK